MEEQQEKKKSTNPLYVVRKNGVDVEEAEGIFDMILKKTGLDKFMPIIEGILGMLLAQVQSYAMFMEVKKFMDSIFEKFIELIFQAQQMMNSFQKKKEA